MTRRTLLGSVGAATMFPQLAAAVNASPPRANMPALEISLRVGATRTGQHGRRHAAVLAGLVQGGLMQGTVQAGQLEWLVDPASGAVDVTIDMRLRGADGTLLLLRDRSVQAEPAPARAPGVPTAPRLFDSMGNALPAQLAGCLDASGLGRGVVWLRAFERA